MNVEYFPFTIPLIELVAAIFATIHFEKYARSNEKYFLYFLWFTFIMDATGIMLNEFTTIETTVWYNVFTPIVLLFYFYWYYSILKSKSFKQMAILSATLFIGMTVLTYIFPKLSGQGYAFVIGVIGLLVLTFFHFYQLLRGDEVLVVKYKLSFWISTALLLFYIGILPLMLLAKYIEINGSNYNIILVSLNVILYGCYIIGFIWTKKKYNRF
ncbi:MAG: hypothetical protein AAFP76_06270 [Bacteroidota bacterium]